MLEVPSRRMLTALADAAAAIMPHVMIGVSRIRSDAKIAVLYSYGYGIGQCVSEPADVPEALLPSVSGPRGAWLTAINPVADFALNERGELTFVNVAEQTGLAATASRYAIEWAAFDNVLGTRSTAVMTGTDMACAQMPPEIVAKRPDFVEVRVATLNRAFTSWASPVTVHFKRTARGRETVGLREWRTAIEWAVQEMPARVERLGPARTW